MFKKLREDIKAVKASDPAATSSVAILLCYPGIQATANHRFENWLWRHGRRGIARFCSQVTRFITGIEIHPGATLGRRVFIDHGMGVIIGETAVVGDDVTIFQGVTLGGTGKDSGKRHPNVENGAVIGVGAAVLGNITIGARSKVGGGAVVVDNVPEDSTVVGIPGRVVWQDGMRICPADPYRRDLLPDPTEAHIARLEERIMQLEKLSGLAESEPEHVSLNVAPADKQEAFLLSQMESRMRTVLDSQMQGLLQGRIDMESGSAHEHDNTTHVAVDHIALTELKVELESVPKIKARSVQ